MVRSEHSSVPTDVTIKKKESERQMRTLTTRIYSSQTKAATTLFLSALLLISFAMAIVPSLVPVKAASPALSVSPTSGRSWLRDSVLWGSTDKYSGATTIYVTGTGFPAEQDDITLRMAESDEDVTATSGEQLILVRYSLNATSSPSSGDNYYVMADASGSFKVTFEVPQTKAGAYNIWAVYTPTDGSETTSPPVAFTVTVGIAVVEENNAGTTTASTGVFNSKVHILVSGFEGGETVSVIPTNFLVTAAFGSTAVTDFVVGEDTTWSGGSTYGTGFTAGDNVGYVTSRKGGDVSVIVFGQTSGLTTSATFTLKATIAVSTTTLSVSMVGTDPKISIPRTAGSINMSLRNWLDDVDVLANTIQLQVSGVSHTTQHAKITTTSNGAYNNVKVTYFEDLPTLPVTVIINGVSFNLESGNLIAPATLLSAQQGVTKPLELTVPVAGALVASERGRPSFLQTSATTIQHYAGGARTLVYVYAINGPAGSIAWGVDWTDLDDADVGAVTLRGITTTDTRGAGIAFISHAADALPGATTGSSAWARGDHSLVGTGDMATAGSVTLTVNPYVGPSTSTPAFTFDTRVYRQTFNVTGFGFEPDESLTVTLDGVTWFSVTTVDADSGRFSVMTDPVKKMAYGDNHLVTFFSSTDGNTFSRVIKSRPGVVRDATTGGEPLTVNAAAAGDPVSLRSSTLWGIFGLKASTAYTVKIAGITVGSFVSTSDGAIPGSISFTAPAIAAGIYYVDILDSTGASAIFPCKYSGAQFRSRNQITVANAVTKLGEGQGLQLTITLKLDVFPTTVSPGENATLSGAGLTPATAYSITLSDSSSGLSGTYVGFVLATCTTTSTGALPAGVTVTMPDVATTTETGTTWFLHASTSDELADSESSGFGPVNIQASLTLTPTSGAVGDKVDYVGRGLAAAQTYTIRFGYVDVDHTGTGVGSLVADNYGRSIGSFNVPAKTAGDYDIQLKRGTSYDMLNIPPTFTITGAAPGVGGPIGTGTFTPSAPALLNSAGSPVSSVTTNTQFFVQVELKSNIGQDLSISVLVQIKDASGNVAAINLNQPDVRGGVTKSVAVVFIGISTPGTYTATIFVWSGITEPTPYAPTTVLVITVT